MPVMKCKGTGVFPALGRSDVIFNGTETSLDDSKINYLTTSECRILTIRIIMVVFRKSTHAIYEM